MDEIINIKINGDAITKDSNVAGNQYECNSKKLRLTFSDNWDGFGKSITFWNAIGENAVKIQLGMDELEDWGNSRVYIVPIPGEAMTEAGECSFVIEGEVDGIVKRTASDKLKVKYSPKAENAGNPESVTPDLATQLRNEIDSMYVDIAEVKQVGDEVNAGLGKVEEAVSLVQSAEQSAIAADNSAWSAAIEAENARDAIANMTVEAETLPPGSDASVMKTDANGVVGLMFGIPEGNSGVYVGSEEPTDPDIKVWIDISGEEDTNYVTRDELDRDLLRHQTQIIAYADIKYASKTDLTEYATKEDLSNVSVDMSDYYTKQETRQIAYQAVSASDDFQDLLGDVRTMQETVAYKSDLTDYATKNEMEEDYLRQQSEIIAYTDIKYAWKTDLGDIESALDSILAIQESIVGGVN